jgi:catechol 2,3-dioxygenase-like lactoylglutathione lyase family enzyme
MESEMLPIDQVFRTVHIGMLDHYNVSTRKLQETIQFYQDVLGFVNGHRPPFNFPGAWLYSAGHPVLHLNDISQTDAQQRDDSGVIDHVAFASPCNVHRSKPSFAGEEDSRGRQSRSHLPTGLLQRKLLYRTTAFKRFGFV